MARTLYDLRRSKPKTAPKRKFVVFCEGVNTEPDYFRALGQVFVGTLIAVEPVGGDPKAVTDKAVSCAESLGLAKRYRRKKRNSFERLDEVWAVFDRDEHPHFENAIRRCSEKNISVARSNPCFEVWLILHYEEFERPDDRHAVQKYLRTICPDYDPDCGKTLNCTQLLQALEIAEGRAMRQLANRLNEGDEFGPPSTTVYQLTERIKTANQRKPKSR